MVLLSLSARRAWIEIHNGGSRSQLYSVALRKESVDRNLGGMSDKLIGSVVALRKESVDRNVFEIRIATIDCMSLSARRAWIEMTDDLGDRLANYCVALRKESVDRNTINKSSIRHRSGRSPQGERG